MQLHMVRGVCRIAAGESNESRHDRPDGRLRLGGHDPRARGLQHEKYAARHGLGYECHFASPLPSNIPQSWGKLPLVLRLLKAGHAPVVWLDADAFVRDPTRNIATACDDGIGAVRYHRPHHHYNMGVFVAWPTMPVIHLVEEVLRYAGQFMLLDARRRLVGAAVFRVS